MNDYELNYLLGDTIQLLDHLCLQNPVAVPTMLVAGLAAQIRERFQRAAEEEEARE